MSFNKNVTPSVSKWRVSLHDADSPHRRRWEEWICSRYRECHGAEIDVFLPKLFSIEGFSGDPIAVAGIRPAGQLPLFVENYLKHPVQEVLSEYFQQVVARGRVVEIGNLAARSLASLGPLFMGVDSLLRAMEFDWAVFTATAVIRPVLERAGFPLVDLGPADAGCLQNRGSWGGYYNCEPRLTAIGHQDVLATSSVSKRLVKMRQDSWRLGRRELSDDAA